MENGTAGAIMLRKHGGNIFVVDPEQAAIPTFPQSILAKYAGQGLYDARSFALIFYHKGADLINKGQAYASRVASQQLLEEYVSLPRFHHKFGREVLSNPLHPLLVIKVALDHTNAVDIMSLFIRIKNDPRNCTRDGKRLVFPNNCRMYNKTAFLQILRAYILKQVKWFANLSAVDKAFVIDPNE